MSVNGKAEKRGSIRSIACVTQVVCQAGLQHTCFVLFCLHAVTHHHRCHSQVLHSLCDMLEVVGCSTNRSILCGKLREQLPLIERALQRGDGVSSVLPPPVLASLTPAGSSLMHAMSDSLATPAS
jgi:hypothetical protein